jgi:hypothetical protein
MHAWLIGGRCMDSEDAIEPAVEVREGGAKVDCVPL